jgi:hypothetical protein
MKSLVTRISIAIVLFAIAKLYGYLMTGVVNYPVNYLVEGIIDTIIVCALPLFGKSTLVRDLQKINCASVIVHAYGFIIYMGYYRPITYDYLLSTVVIIQWARLLWVRDDDTNNTDNNFRLDSFYHAYFCMSGSNSKVQNK